MMRILAMAAVVFAAMSALGISQVIIGPPVIVSPPPMTAELTVQNGEIILDISTTFECDPPMVFALLPGGGIIPIEVGEW